jgi:hypothetical protein
LYQLSGWHGSVFFLAAAWFSSLHADPVFFLAAALWLASRLS